MLRRKRRHKQPSIARLLNNNTCFGFAILVLVLLFVRLLAPVVIKKQQVYEQKQLLEEKIKVTEQANSQLEKNINRLLHDKEYIEQIAREKLGLMRENEVVYQIVEEDSLVGGKPTYSTP